MGLVLSRIAAVISTDNCQCLDRGHTAIQEDIHILEEELRQIKHGDMWNHI